MEGERISFDGIPFTVAEIHKFYCQFGPQYYKEHASKLHIRLQGTRKMGCPAHIHIHKLHLYLTFNVANVEATLGSRKLKEVRAKRLAELKEDMTKGIKVEFQTKYFVLLHEQRAHENFHPIGNAALFTGKVHPRIIQKIHDLVADGITSVQEVKKALRHVLHVLGSEIKIKPDEASRTYYQAEPITNHNRYTKSCILSTKDT